MGVTFHAPESVGKCEGMNPTLPSELSLWESESRWTPDGLPNFQRVIGGVKIHWIEEFIILLNFFWNLDV
jgi:hypothetical protein